VQNDEKWSRMSLLTVILPFAATIASLLCGVVIGGAAAWIVKPSTQPIEYMKTASLAELQQVCDPVVEEQETQLAKVKQEIADLREEVARKEAEVVSLRAAADRKGRKGSGSSGSAELAGELERVKEELAEAKLQLAMMEEVKNQLVEQLSRTQERLAVAEAELVEQVAIAEVLRDENGKLKDDVIVQRWFRFVNDAQLGVCEHGGKKKTLDCRAAVVREISQIKREFVHCVRSEQAAPMAKHLDKGETLPHFARLMDQDDRHLEGWYLQMCDPTLPELADAEEVAVVTQPAATTPQGDFELELEQ
jgi:hypothetical protein